MLPESVNLDYIHTNLPEWFCDPEDESAYVKYLQNPK